MLLAAACAAPAQEAFALRDGDRVVFFGDSITDQRLYTTFAETYVVTRFPHTNISLVHSGWGGDRVTGGGGGPMDVRIWRDVLPYNPTVVTVMLGMNDGRYRAFDQAIFDEFTTGFKHIVDTFKRQLPDARITLMQPSPYDDVTRTPTFEGGYNQVLVRYGDFLKQLAADQKLGLADINTPVVEALKKANAADAAERRQVDSRSRTSGRRRTSAARRSPAQGLECARTGGRRGNRCRAEGSRPAAQHAYRRPARRQEASPGRRPTRRCPCRWTGAIRWWRWSYARRISWRR